MSEVRRANRPIPALLIQEGDYVIPNEDGTLELWRPSLDPGLVQLAIEAGALIPAPIAEPSPPSRLRLLASRVEPAPVPRRSLGRAQEGL